MSVFICNSKLFLVLSLFFLIFQYNNGKCQTKPNYATISGEVRNFKGQVEVENLSDEGELMLGLNQIKFYPDSNGKFSVSFKLVKPNYYRIGRNILYLSPGCNYKVFIDYKWPEHADFKGCNRAENLYLRFTPFPFAGSFLESGDSVKSTIQETISCILESAKRRRNDLNQLVKVDKVFLKLESARIQADIINSLKYISTYFPYINKLKGDSLEMFRKEYKETVNPYLREYSLEFTKSEYLKIQVYRLNTFIILNNGDSVGKEAAKLNEYLECFRIANHIDTWVNENKSDSFKFYMRAVKNPFYKSTLENNFKFIQSRFSGRTPDLKLLDTAGNYTYLSSFKGKVIFIEFWATWCGPCVKEFSYMDSLRLKYKQRGDILIISLSIDQDLQKWKEVLKSRTLTGLQFNIQPSLLQELHVLEIPRSIIINRNYNITSMFGPNPSNKEVYKIIQAVLDK